MLRWGHLLRSVHLVTAVCVGLSVCVCVCVSVYVCVCAGMGASPKKRPPWHSCVCGSICVCVLGWGRLRSVHLGTAVRVCVCVYLCVCAGMGASPKKRPPWHSCVCVCVCVCVSVCVCWDEGISYGSVHLGAVGPKASPGRMGQQFPCSSKSEGASQQKTDSKGLFFLRSLQVPWCLSAPITSIFYGFTVEGGLALAGHVRNDVFSLLKAAAQRTTHWNQQRGLSLPSPRSRLRPGAHGRWDSLGFVCKRRSLPPTSQSGCGNKTW